MSISQSIYTYTYVCIDIERYMCISCISISSLTFTWTSTTCDYVISSISYCILIMYMLYKYNSSLGVRTPGLLIPPPCHHRIVATTLLVEAWNSIETEWFWGCSIGNNRKQLRDWPNKKGKFHRFSKYDSFVELVSWGPKRPHLSAKKMGSSCHLCLLVGTWAHVPKTFTTLIHCS